VAWSSTVAQQPSQFEVGVARAHLEGGAQVVQEVGQGVDRALELDDLAGELVDPPRHVRVAVEDLDLDLVDVVLQPVQHGAVVVDDLSSTA